MDELIVEGLDYEDFVVLKKVLEQNTMFSSKEDDSNNSILVCIPEEHFGTIFRELKKLGYKMVFKTRIEKSNSLTCTFIKI